jgi:DNA (cytosine-5)-methyltransferase 1
MVASAPAVAFTERTRADGRNVEAQDVTAFNWQNAGNEGYAFTKDATGPLDTSQTKAIYGPAMAVRRLLPVECCRLQGFPDWWLDDLGLSDSAKYRMLGNAVCVPVVEWLAARLAEAGSRGGG